MTDSESEVLTYEKDLWDCFDSSVRRSEESLDSCREIRDYFKRRSAIEEDYAKALASLARKTRVGRGNPAQGGDAHEASAADSAIALNDHRTVAKAWETVVSQTERCSQYHAAFAVSLKESAADSLQNFITAMKANRDALASEGHKLGKLMNESKDNLTRAHAAYDKACRECDEIKLSTKKKDMAKVEGKEATAKEKEVEYRSALTNTNYFQDKFCNEQMPEIQRNFQQMEEKRVDIVKETLVAFLTALYKLPECYSTCYKAVHAAVSSINRKVDMQAHIRATRTGREKPQSFEFRPYSADAEPVEKLGLRATLKAKGVAMFRNKMGGGAGGSSSSSSSSSASAAAASGASGAAPVGSGPGGGSGSPKPLGKTYGLTLAECVANAERDGVPAVMVSLTDAVLRCGGATTEGIFRIPADRGEVEALKARLDRLDLDVPGTDPHVPAGALKLWLRELRDPLIPDTLYDDCLALGADPDADAARALLDRLPELNRRVVSHMCRFLAVFAREENALVSKMSAPNLAMVFAPGFLRYAGDNPAALLTNNNNEKACVLQFIELEMEDEEAVRAGRDPALSHMSEIDFHGDDGGGEESSGARSEGSDDDQETRNDGGNGDNDAAADGE